MAENETKKEQLLLADKLALERTHLANERTLLAYLRSTLIGVVTALTILKLFPEDPSLKIAALVMGPTSIGAGLFGIYRFFSFRKRLLDIKKAHTR
jgi:putative membrane protein